MKDHLFSYNWQFRVSASPSELWPFLSNTNRLFKDLGQLPVHKIPITNEQKDGHLQLGYDQLHRNDLWIEEPYQWEAPYRYNVKREYKTGPYRTFKVQIDLNTSSKGTIVRFSFSGEARDWLRRFWVIRQFNTSFKRRIKLVLNSYDDAIKEKRPPYIKKYRVVSKSEKKWSLIEQDLAERSNNKELSAHLIRFLKNADEQDLKRIKPETLASLWKKPLDKVTEIMMFAANMEILNFSWDLVCPGCRKTSHNTQKLVEVTEPLYCDHCEEEFRLDFNHTIQLVFQPHPMVRKFSKKNYCLGNPSERSHIVLQQYLYPGQKKYLKIRLKPGDYHFKSNLTEGILLLKVVANGVDNVSINIWENEFIGQDINISSEPNLVIQNQKSEPLLAIIERVEWNPGIISAAEITSNQTFRSLYPQELLRDSEKIQATDLTVMFTDLNNSTRMYATEGDESAIGQVIDHFEIIRQVVTEERGAIVKTIGDAVMAIFTKPHHAIRAFDKARELLENARDGKPAVKLKAGIHIGNCVALTLNNRIDYFGTTVNMAARFVELSRGNDIVLSEKCWNSTDVQIYLNSKRHTINIHHFDTTIKGFEDQTFELKRITMGAQSLKLVI